MPSLYPVPSSGHEPGRSPDESLQAEGDRSPGTSVQHQRQVSIRTTTLYKSELWVLHCSKLSTLAGATTESNCDQWGAARRISAGADKPLVCLPADLEHQPAGSGQRNFSQPDGAAVRRHGASQYVQYTACLSAVHIPATAATGKLSYIVHVASDGTI